MQQNEGAAQPSIPWGDDIVPVTPFTHPAPAMDDPAGPHDTEGIMRQPSRWGYWKHDEDGTLCPVHLAGTALPRDGAGKWWCSFVQQRVDWVELGEPE